MKTTIRSALVGVGLVGGALLVTPALADEVTTSVDPVTGATVTVHQRSALLPRNRTREVIVRPGVQPQPYYGSAYGAAVTPDPYAAPVDPYYDPAGYDGVVQRYEETTVERY